MKVDTHMHGQHPRQVKAYAAIDDVVDDFSELLMTFNAARSSNSREPVYSGEVNGINIHVSTPKTHPDGAFVSTLAVPLSELPITSMAFLSETYSALLQAPFPVKRNIKKPGGYSQEPES